MQGLALAIIILDPNDDRLMRGAFGIIKLFVANPVGPVVTYHGPSYGLPDDLWNSRIPLDVLMEL